MNTECDLCMLWNHNQSSSSLRSQSLQTNYCYWLRAIMYILHITMIWACVFLYILIHGFVAQPQVAVGTMSTASWGFFALSILRRFFIQKSAWTNYFLCFCTQFGLFWHLRNGSHEFSFLSLKWPLSGGTYVHGAEGGSLGNLPSCSNKKALWSRGGRMLLCYTNLREVQIIHWKLYNMILNLHLTVNANVSPPMDKYLL